MVVPLGLGHALSLSYFQIIAGTYNSSGSTMKPITAKTLWMVSGNSKKCRIQTSESSRVIINSVEEFSVAANKFVLSIPTLFHKEKDLLCQPDDINQSLSIPATLQIHKFVRSSTAEGGTIIDFYFLSNGKEPCHTQSYSERKCGHVERKYEF